MNKFYCFNRNFVSLLCNNIILIFLTLFFFTSSSCKRRYYSEQDHSPIIYSERGDNAPNNNGRVRNLENSISGKVVGISDGDTFSLLFDNGFSIKVRLNGIDCPEKKQAFSKRAKKVLSDLIFGKSVKVDYNKKDRYGRVLGDVYCNGLHINSEMVKRGMAWHFKNYSDDKELARLEEEAKNSKIGIWSDPNAEPPWEYRKIKKN